MKLDPLRIPPRVPEGPITRFAPGPTGFLHLGHIVNALYVWGLARAHGGTVIGRMEDHDRHRSRVEYDAAIREDLTWLGLAPDGPWLRQSDDFGVYAAAAETLRTRGLVYTCVCSRAALLLRNKDKINHEGEIPYDNFCRDAGHAPGPGRSLRLRLDGSQTESFTDLLLGRRTQAVGGDLLIQDAKGNWTYQFAVVLDDLRQNISLVIRGQDLLDSTARQIRLGRLLGRAEPPDFLHHGLVLGADGRKLSKSARSRSIRELRHRGRSPDQVLDLAARAAGLQDRPRPLRAAEIKYLFL